MAHLNGSITLRNEPVKDIRQAVLNMAQMTDGYIEVTADGHWTDEQNWPVDFLTIFGAKVIAIGYKYLTVELENGEQIRIQPDKNYRNSQWTVQIRGGFEQNSHFWTNVD